MKRIFIPWLFLFSITAGTAQTTAPSREVNDPINAEKKFLAANGKRTDVVTTASGLQYEIMAKGSGVIPTIADQVKVHYRGRLLNGETFDNSFDRGEPMVFPVNAVIKGWQEGLLLMPAGSKFRLFIPSALAYGPRETGTIKANSMLVFDVELFEVIGKSPVVTDYGPSVQKELQKKIMAIIADGNKDFIKFRGALMPRANFESESDSSFNYSISLGGKREKLRWNGITKSYSFSSAFDAKDGSQLSSAARVKSALDSISALAVREKKGKIVNTDKAVYLKITDNDEMFYYVVDNSGNLTNVYFQSTSPRQIAQSRESEKAYKANAANPAVQESYKRLQFLNNSGAMKDLMTGGFQALSKQYLDALKANPNDWPAVKKAYRMKMENELLSVETNYRNWEKFLETAKTIDAANISKDKLLIAAEKEYVDKRRKMIPQMFAD